jgi:exodeoxyribonuclease-3
MKIISYNVNGIRADLSKDFTQWLSKENPDILCLQETKAQPDQIDTLLFAEMGYTSYLHSAEKKGYSGVAILAKQTPQKVVIGMNVPRFDNEGRVIRADFDNITVVCVYIPSGSSGELRQAYKMDFLAAFEQYIEQLRNDRPNIIVCGDYNICHKAIDINHPERQIGVSGFLPEERAWLEKLESTGMVDSFREFDKSPEKYSWWSYRGGARSRNMGWRIDYHWVSIPLRQNLISAAILVDAIHSDHCPVMVEIDSTK